MKKYDCSKTLDYMHEINRACATYKRCSDGCPMKEHTCTTMGGITQEGIDALQKWSDEHPEAPKLRKRELDFITMFKWYEDKRIERGVSGYLFLVFDEDGEEYKYNLCKSWFSFIGKDESMTFEELLKLDVEGEE